MYSRQAPEKKFQRLIKPMSDEIMITLISRCYTYPWIAFGRWPCWPCLYLYLNLCKCRRRREACNLKGITKNGTRFFCVMTIDNFLDWEVEVTTDVYVLWTSCATLRQHGTINASGNALPKLRCRSNSNLNCVPSLQI